MTGIRVTKSPEGQLERSTPYVCEACGVAISGTARNGSRKKFCSRRCKDRWTNTQRLKGEAALKAKIPAVQRQRKARAVSIRTLDQLSMAEGLPAGSYSAGALGRIGRCSVAQIIPPSEQLGLLVEAAQRLGITEGEALKAARWAARHAASNGEAA